MNIDQNILLQIQDKTISTGKAKELLEKDVKDLMSFRNRQIDNIIDYIKTKKDIDKKVLINLIKKLKTN